MCTVVGASQLHPYPRAGFPVLEPQWSAGPASFRRQSTTLPVGGSPGRGAVCEHACMAQHWLMNREDLGTVSLVSAIVLALGRVGASNANLKARGGKS
jgi:hypothetical protein